MIGNLRLVVAFGSVFFLLLTMVPVQLIGLVLARAGWTKLAGIMPVLFHRILLFVLDIRLTLDGELSKDRPLLLAANHLSWLDIVVVGAISPLSFVAKSEMKNWPIFGTLAKLQRTVFIRRGERRDSGNQAGEIAERMTAREIMVLFPEGTTTDGNQLAPFKTSLFEAAKIALTNSPVETAIVQPIAIHYTHLHGLPIDRARRPHVAWPGELGLGESIFPIVREGALDVTIHIGQPIPLNEASNRKIIASDAAKAIRSMLDSSSTAG